MSTKNEILSTAISFADAAEARINEFRDAAVAEVSRLRTLAEQELRSESGTEFVGHAESAPETPSTASDVETLTRMVERLVTAAERNGIRI